MSILLGKSIEIPGVVGASVVFFRVGVGLCVVGEVGVATVIK